MYEYDLKTDGQEQKNPTENMVFGDFWTKN